MSKKFLVGIVAAAALGLIPATASASSTNLCVSSSQLVSVTTPLTLGGCLSEYTLTTFGEVGPEGKEGKTGATGATGATGPEGPKGAEGEVGAQGLKGEKGEKGTTGATGATGPEGKEGKGLTFGAYTGSVAMSPESSGSESYGTTPTEVIVTATLTKKEKESAFCRIKVGGKEVTQLLWENFKTEVTPHLNATFIVPPSTTWEWKECSGWLSLSYVSLSI
jgi:hypothetical protein